MSRKLLREVRDFLTRREMLTVEGSDEQFDIKNKIDCELASPLPKPVAYRVICDEIAQLRLFVLKSEAESYVSLLGRDCIIHPLVVGKESESDADQVLNKANG